MIIGLGGYAFSGKDAVADILESQHGWKRTFMSKPLMQALLALDPLIPEGRGHIRYTELVQRVGYDQSKKNPEVRQLLQRLGTEVGRHLLGENVWVDVVCREATQLADDCSSVAITGIRYGNELARIREMGGVLVWVARPGYEPVNAHSSELSLGPDDFDVVLHNDSDLAGLARRVDLMLQSFDEAAGFPPAGTSAA